VGHPTPVGLYPKGDTSEGLCDMLGNVLEWCSDWWEPYQKLGQQDPVDSARKYRVLRGGSLFNDSVYASWRGTGDPKDDREYDNRGFRCARDL